MTTRIMSKVLMVFSASALSTLRIRSFEQFIPVTARKKTMLTKSIIKVLTDTLQDNKT